MSTQNNGTAQIPQQPVQGYYVVNMSTAPYAAYPTTANSQVPVFQNPVPQPYYPTPNGQPQFIPPPQSAQPAQPQASYYVPQSESGPFYYYDASSASVPMGYAPNSTENAVPLLTAMPLKDRLYMREYEVKCSQWLEESWELFKQHWVILVFWTLLVIGIQFVPYVGGILCFMLYPGPFIAAAHYARSKTWINSSLFHGIYLFFPLFVIAFLYSLLVGIGFFLCILPGLYFAIAYGFSMFIYIEFRQEGLGVIDAMSVCRHVLSKNFWSITGYFLFHMLIVLLGCLALGVGVFVSLPVAAMMNAFAFRDIFGFSEKRMPDNKLVCC